MTTQDPLASWRAGAVKARILEFVSRVTQEGGPDYVPPSERIATFDNDGTLWCEFPVPVQVFFTLDELEGMAERRPELRALQPFKAFLERDVQTIAGFSKQDAFAPAFMTHAGMTMEEFHASAAAWFETAKHPRLGRPFTDCTYRPQRELLDYLRSSGFHTFIVTGGGAEFVRVVSQRLYGIPPGQVVGSSTKVGYEISDTRVILRKLPALGSFNDKAEKAVNIGLQIGQRPVLAFGNSDGDLAMLRYTLSGRGARLALLLHHDDAQREYAYDRAFKISPLAEGLDRAAEYGVQLVSMKEDWSSVFGP